MSTGSCREIEPLVTPYLDGEIAEVEREAVDVHLRHCWPCRSRVAAERTVRDLLRAERDALCADRAPVPLRERCTASARPQTSLRDRWMPLSIAAVLVAGVAGVSVYQATARSEAVLAAQLTLDHLKCFTTAGASPASAHASADAEALLASSCDWRIQVSARVDAAQLELVGSRPCLTGAGKSAHLLYRHQGQPVSVFVLPGTVRPARLVEVMGHEAVIWSREGRTFVLVTKSPKEEAARVASVVQAALR